MRFVLIAALAFIAASAGGGVAHAGCNANQEWQDAGPRWSPDGSRIAFYRVLRGCGGPVAVYVVPARGGTARQVGEAYGQWPAGWSPDGRMLAFGGRNGLVVSEIGGRGLDQVTRGTDFAPAWSPDGAWIAYRHGRGRGELWIVRPNGSGARRLADDLHDVTLPVWSPNAREIAFSAYAGASTDIHVVDVATGAVRVVASSPAPDYAPSWADASTIEWTSERDGVPYIYAAVSDGSNVRRWIDGGDAANSPRDFASAYLRSDGIWYEWGALAPTLAVPRTDVLGRVEWRPHGSGIPTFAFSAGGRCGRYGIYVWTEGTRERRLTNPCEFHGSGLVRGTPNRDYLYGGAHADRLLAGDGRDLLDGGDGDDRLEGGDGADTLFGRRGADLLIGGDDADVLVGGFGRDRVVAGPGKDVVHVRDGRRDTVDCGRGSDIVYAERIDVVARNCELVRR